MKRRTFAAPITIAFAAALVASTAAALSTDSIVGDVVSATGGNGQINVTVDGSTVTLTGYAEDQMVAAAARRAALEHEEVDNVIDLITQH